MYLPTYLQMNTYFINVFRIPISRAKIEKIWLWKGVFWVRLFSLCSCSTKWRVLDVKRKKVTWNVKPMKNTPWPDITLCNLLNNQNKTLLTFYNPNTKKKNILLFEIFRFSSSSFCVAFPHYYYFFCVDLDLPLTTLPLPLYITNSTPLCHIFNHFCYNLNNFFVFVLFHFSVCLYRFGFS